MAFRGFYAKKFWDMALNPNSASARMRQFGALTSGDTDALLSPWGPLLLS